MDLEDEDASPLLDESGDSLHDEQTEQEQQATPRIGGCMGGGGRVA